MDYKELIERTKCPDSVRGCKYLGLYDFSCKKCREQTMKDCTAAIETLLAEREAQREVAEDIADDFVDFVTGGVPNVAPYCANMRPECCERPGWCTGQSKECKGFFPKAARGTTPPDRQQTER